MTRRRCGHWIWRQRRLLILVVLTAVFAWQGARTPVAAHGRTKVNRIDGLTYVWIPPGTFRMGCSQGDSECFDNEKPAHTVTLTRGFWIGQTPVTQAEYLKVMGSNPSKYHGAQLPAEEVTWDNAKAYCERIKMRLPPRPNGNMRPEAAPARERAMPRSRISRGITPTPHLQPTLSRRSSRMPSAFTTSWETYGSGWRIGMVHTLLPMRLTHGALKPGSFEWGAEALGTTAHRLPALRAEATTAAAVVPPATVSGAPPIEPFRDGGAYGQGEGSVGDAEGHPRPGRRRGGEGEGQCRYSFTCRKVGGPGVFYSLAGRKIPLPVEFH